MRTVKKRDTKALDPTLKTPKTPVARVPDLPETSLAAVFVLAAGVIASVREGRSLNEAMLTLKDAPPPVRRDAHDIIYGILRRYAWGECILSHLLQKPLGHPETYALLLATLFRLETRLGSAHTVVNQAVIAASQCAQGAFKGLVNGVLRNYLRTRETILSAVDQNEEARLSYPAWWIRRVQKRWPTEWESILAAGNTIPPLVLRVNRRKVRVEDYHTDLKARGIEARRVGEDGLRLTVSVPVESLPGFSEGWVSVQDLGAQQAQSLLAPADGMRVLDACAAPGGKAAHLLEYADIKLLALDISEVRTKRILENLKRLGLVATVKTADCCALESWWSEAPFDAILADVPCTGSGVVRHHPDIKYLRRESDIRQFRESQAKILDALWTTLKPGGRLLYATCSIFDEENKGQIDAFLVRAPSVECLFEKQYLPSHENDGFYYALLRKTA